MSYRLYESKDDEGEFFIIPADQFDRDVEYDYSNTPDGTLYVPDLSLIEIKNFVVSI